MDIEEILGFQPDLIFFRCACPWHFSEFSTCSQHVKFTFINCQEFHACISYIPAHMLGNDTHVRAMKNNFELFPCSSHVFLQLVIRENSRHACIFFVHSGSLNGALQRVHHHAVAFAIASEICCKRPFARNFCSKN